VCQGQLRVTLDGIIGLDLSAWLSVAADLGYDRSALLWMLPSVEVAIVRTLNESENPHG